MLNLVKHHFIPINRHKYKVLPAMTTRAFEGVAMTIEGAFFYPKDFFRRR
jgi:hypothetical protein